MERERAFPVEGLGRARLCRGAGRPWNCRVTRGGHGEELDIWNTCLVELLCEALSEGTVSANTKSLLFIRQRFRYWGQSGEQDSKCPCCFRAGEEKK